MNEINLHDHLEALWVEREKLINARWDANTKLLEAKNKELAHRLEVLNNAHEKSLEDKAEAHRQSQQDREEFVRLSTYGPMVDELGKWRADVNKAITVMTTRSITWTAAMGVILIVIQVVLRFWKT